MPSAVATLPQRVDIPNIQRIENNLWSRVSLRYPKANSRILPPTRENRQQQGRAAACVIWPLPLKHSDASNRCLFSGNTWVLIVSPSGSVRLEKKRTCCFAGAATLF
ncbi:uncharacterized protein TrAtP1_005538 [Trichoderma atroviride]|uniref:uncharacterized protein n=1 Tax=Hypocrea atroviridis TaxID=63577 RepID=UPI00332698D2|nr:hypothetical protein TrAtP1_005538 [Trichoderma atroviride]